MSLIKLVEEVNAERRTLELGRLGNILSKCFNSAVQKDNKRLEVRSVCPMGFFFAPWVFFFLKGFTVVFDSKNFFFEFFFSKKLFFRFFFQNTFIFN